MYNCRHQLAMGISLFYRVFVIIRVSFLHMSLAGQAVSQM